MDKVNRLLSPSLSRLVRILSCKGPCSLDLLSHELEISKGDTLSLLQRLMDYTLPIQEVGGLYYLNRACIPLDPQKLRSLESQTLEYVDVYETLSSTNTFLRESPRKSAMCITEQQWEGRGRFGRGWDSPFGQNIYCSLLIPFFLDQDLSCLGIVVSLSVAATLETFYGQKGVFKVKWPNDVLLNGLKVGGILVEFQNKCLTHQGTVIGIGLNVNSPYTATKERRSFLTCESYFNVYTDRNDLCVQVVQSLLNDLLLFQKKGFSHFQERWPSYDYFLNEIIILKGTVPHTQGLNRGIDAQGRLIVELASNDKKTFASQEVSLGSPTHSRE